MELEYFINDENELDNISEKIIEKFSSKVFLFYGEMGVGKTAFIKKICRKLNVIDMVSSPTFSIVNEYLTNENQKIYHFDFYRTTKKSEIFDLGYEEYFYSKSYCFIEWPERIATMLPDNYIQIKMNKVGEARQIYISEIKN